MRNIIVNSTKLLATLTIMFGGITGISFAQEPLPEEVRQTIYRRAMEAVIWGQPAEGMRGFIQATQRDLGGDWNDVIYFSQPMTSRHGFLTANNQTPYVISSITTKNGPIVVDLPPASNNVKYFGSIIDAWQKPIADVGPFGDDQGKGGKYLLLPPDYQGKVPNGYIVYQPKTYSSYIGFRPVSDGNATAEEIITYAKQLQIYPLAQADNPPATRYIDAYPKKWNTLPRYDLTYFEDIAWVINYEPVQERDLVMMGMLESLGIKKGQEFNPDPETREILETAVQDAYDYMQWYFTTPGKGVSRYWENRQWGAFNIPKEQADQGFPFSTENELLLDTRAGAAYFYITFLPKKLGAGSFYLTGLRDSDGNLFDGQSLYKLNVPADTPAGDFWSAIAYSMKTKGFIENNERVGLSSLDKENLQFNEDGSVDIYFGAKPPQGLESNWIPTGEDFFLLFRLYGPQKPLFEKTWQLPDVEKVN